MSRIYKGIERNRNLDHAGRAQANERKRKRYAEQRAAKEAAKAATAQKKRR